MKKILLKLTALAYGQYYNLLSLIASRKTAEKAFHLFCTVRKGKVLAHQKEFLNAAKSELLRIGEHDIQIYQWPGQKETVLLVHGWESNTFRWRNLITKLKEGHYNVLAFDAPAHGHSSGTYLYVPLYAEILQQLVLKYRPRTLIGHSVAGMTLLYNAYRNPDPEVEKMVTIGSPSEFHEIMEHFQKILKFNKRVLLALDDYIHTRFGFHIHEFSTSEYVKTNGKKGLLFHDKLDKVAPYHASVDVNANWKNSTLISTEGLGHSMHQEEVNDQIISFLEA